MAAQAQRMQSLVESWETFMVPETSKHEVCHEADPTSLQSVYFSTLCELLEASELSPSQRHLTASSCVSPLHNRDPRPMRLSSNLWLLSLVSHNHELMRTVSQLFLQFNQQFSDVVKAHQLEVEQLRARQETQLACLLDVGADVTADMIVASSVTEHLVAQHQQEVESLLARCAAEERALEAELRQNFFDLLQISAPDAIAALAAKTADTESPKNLQEGPLRAADSSQSLADEWVNVSESQTAGSSVTAPASSLHSPTSRSALQYKAEVDMSRFASRRPREDPATARSRAGATATYTVPVRTLVLPDPSPPPKPLAGHKSSDAASRAVVLDVSPTSGLRDCLLSCRDTASPVAAAAAREHLMRLAHTKHAMLLLMGSQQAARELLQGSPSPELLLGGRWQHDTDFVPLPGVENLQILFTTRFWGANIVLLWEPPVSQQTAASGATAIPLSDPDAVGACAVESALRLAVSWNVDMFSVALLSPGGGSLLPSSTELRSLPGELTPHVASFDVLRLVRDAMASILHERSHSRTPQLWTVQDEELLSRRYWTETSTPSCPRAVGARYFGIGSAGGNGYAGMQGCGNAASRSREGSTGMPAQPQSSLRRRPSHPRSPIEHGPQKRAVSLPLAASHAPASPTLVALPSPVYFNTPMAIRVFLPWPERWFTADSLQQLTDPAEAVADAKPHTSALRGDRANSCSGAPRAGLAAAASDGGGPRRPQPPELPSAASWTSVLTVASDTMPARHDDSDSDSSFAIAASHQRGSPQRQCASPLAQQWSLSEVVRCAFADSAQVY